MLKIAFASADMEHVDMHFGAAERFVIYQVSPGVADLVGVGEFVRVQMKGENKARALAEGATVAEEIAAVADEPAPPPEDKVLAKLDFLQGCAAVYAASVGVSSIKRLMTAGIQPIIVDNGHEIVDLLNEVSFAMAQGGLPWVDRALARGRSKDRFEMMEKEGWVRSEQVESGTVVHQLITSVDDAE